MILKESWEQGGWAPRTPPGSAIGDFHSFYVGFIARRAQHYYMFGTRFLLLRLFSVLDKITACNQNFDMPNVTFDSDTLTWEWSKNVHS